MPRLNAALPAVAALFLLAGCANPTVPDFMVEGRLPDFGGDRTVKSDPPVAQAAPKPDKTAQKPVETAQKPAQTAPKPARIKPEKHPQPVMAGGFGPVTDKATIDTISTFAMRSAPNGYLLKSVKSVRSQVVAGTNYELCLRVRTPGHEASWIRQRLVKAVVWQKLDKSLELTSWNEVETCE